MLSQKITFFTVFLLVIVEGNYAPNEGGGYHQGGGGYQEVKKEFPYLPAPPGETPHCAKGGATYCEKIETYPEEVINYLLYKWGRTYEQFIKSETDRDFVLLSQPPSYGPPAPLPFDSYYPKDTNEGYLPPSPQQGNNNNGSTGGGYNDKQYVDSYYRKRQPTNGGYDYSYAIPQGQGSTTNYAETAMVAAAVPPILHSVWWNHRNPNNGQEAYPHLRQYNQDGWGQRWRRRVKRQAESNTLCPVVNQFITPRAAMTNGGNWMYVVNMESAPQYQQQVRSETCARGNGSPCSGLCSVTPGRSATCRQKYVQKRLVALDGSGASLRTDVFWLPHCCSCEVN